MKRKIIFICGHPGSGKTTFAKRLAGYLLKEKKFISHDWYLKHSSEERKKHFENKIKNHFSTSSEIEEDPKKWYDNKNFLKDLKTLKTKGKFKIKNAWNQESGKKDLNLNLYFKNRDIIICEGIYLLHKDISKYADITIYLKSSLKKSLKYQEVRDSHRTSKESIIYKRYLAKKYSEPYFKENKKYADITINKSYKDNKLKEISKSISNKL